MSLNLNRDRSKAHLAKSYKSEADMSRFEHNELLLDDPYKKNVLCADSVMEEAFT